MPLTDSLQKILIRDLRAFGREIALFPDDTSLWAVLPGLTNSSGNLALHVAGNLQHFIGTVLGGTDYLRDRDREFAQRSGTRQQLRALLDQTARVIERVLPRLDAPALAAPYPAAPGGLAVSTGTWLLHLATHLAFHLGQAGALRRALTGSSVTAGAMGLKELQE